MEEAHCGSSYSGCASGEDDNLVFQCGEQGRVDLDVCHCLISPIKNVVFFKLKSQLEGVALRRQFPSVN